MEEMTQKERVLDFYHNPYETYARNSMGCSENWYNPLYAIANTFEKTEIINMNDREVDNLYRLAWKLSEAFY